MQRCPQNTCCFSGYRPEKMPFSESNFYKMSMLRTDIVAAILDAYANGYRHFISGMSTGFDLWAAECVLSLRTSYEISLVCAIPFEEQAKHFSPEWKRRYNNALLRADQVFILSPTYHHGCYAARNQYMVDHATRLICYHHGTPGGTAQTVRFASQAGLSIVNLADPQTKLLDF